MPNSRNNGYFVGSLLLTAPDEHQFLNEVRESSAQVAATAPPYDEPTKLTRSIPSASEKPVTISACD